MIGDKVIVFEDHAGAKEGAVLDATKARQVASHPAWIRSNVPGAETATIVPVLVTPAKEAAVGALPSLSQVSFWPLDEFRDWAEAALVAIRDLRRSFSEPGDLVWRASAAGVLEANRLDCPGLINWLAGRKADKLMQQASH